MILLLKSYSKLNLFYLNLDPNLSTIPQELWSPRNYWIVPHYRPRTLSTPPVMPKKEINSCYFHVNLCVWIINRDMPVSHMLNNNKMTINLDLNIFFIVVLPSVVGRSFTSRKTNYEEKNWVQRKRNSFILMMLAGACNRN